MFKNHLKIAWRNLLKDRQFTLLNMLGLSAGLACALFIFLWVNDERSYDRFFANDDQLYQVMEHRNSDGDIKVSDESSGLVSEILKAQMPQVEYAASLAPPEWFQQFTLSVGDKNIKAKGQYAGKDYFNIQQNTALIQAAYSFFHTAIFTAQCKNDWRVLISRCIIFLKTSGFIKQKSSVQN